MFIINVSSVRIIFHNNLNHELIIVIIVKIVIIIIIIILIMLIIVMTIIKKNKIRLIFNLTHPVQDTQLNT